MRSFVFISRIPPPLLEPLYDEDEHQVGKPRKHKSYRDPAYERLRRLLVAHTSGVMLVMHLGDRGFGLALYASEEEALQACRSVIYPDGRPAEEQHGTSIPLQLRIVQKDRPLLPEAVYTPTILIEGEEVRKDSLAMTLGLERVYRSQAVPQWCPETKRGVDCVMGMSCRRIHLAAVQRTGRKRPRMPGEGEEDEASGWMSAKEEEVVGAVVEESSRSDAAYERLVPPPLRRPGVGGEGSTIRVPLTRERLRAWLGVKFSADATSSELEMNIVEEMKTAMKKAKTKEGALFFFRLSLPGGAPWEWALCDEAVGLPQLRSLCPLPENGAPTPLERDVLSQQLWFWLNQLCAFDSVKEGIAAIRKSKRVRDAVEESCGALDDVSVVALPWLYLPTVTTECSCFITGLGGGGGKEGDHRVRVLQRRGELRCALSASLLQTELRKIVGGEGGGGGKGGASTGVTRVEAVRDALRRVAVLQRGVDEEAEAFLEEELRHHGQLFYSASQLLSRHLALLTQGPSPLLPPSAALAIHIVAAPQPPVVPPAFLLGRASGTALPAPAATVVEPVVLSFSTYMRELNESPWASSKLSRGRGEVGEYKTEFNTTRHSYDPLFSREELLRLKPRDG